MPGPSSHTLARTQPSTMRRQTSICPPSGENETALSSRFSTTRSIRSGTPSTRG
jgi:hypothetical protein